MWHVISPKFTNMKTEAEAFAVSRMYGILYFVSDELEDLIDTNDFTICAKSFARRSFRKKMDLITNFKLYPILDNDVYDLLCELNVELNAQIKPVIEKYEKAKKDAFV